MDVIISNCVINLTPGQAGQFPGNPPGPEARRPHPDLRFGDRGNLPADVRQSAMAWADCLAGAMEKEAYLETIRLAGFAEVTVVSESPYEAPGMDERLHGKIISVKVRAFKG